MSRKLRDGSSAYRESVKRDSAESTVPTNYEGESVKNSNVSNQVSGTTIVNNNIDSPSSGEQALLPTEISTEYQGDWIDYKEEKAGTNGRTPASKMPSLVIDRSKLAELNKSLLEEFKIDPFSPFVLKVWIKDGSQKKLIEIAVENMLYKGKMILSQFKMKSIQIFLKK